jgi:hypothetical protein
MVLAITTIHCAVNAPCSFVEIRSKGGEVEDDIDVFDFPTEEPETIFIDPFLCGVNPGEWEQLFEVAFEHPEDPLGALRRAGALPAEGAVIYLTPSQADLLRRELESMGPSPSATTIELTAYYFRDCLSRARLANGRAPVRSKR